jgi:hypothetical protein
MLSHDEIILSPVQVFTDLSLTEVSAFDGMPYD